jgi:hypothetical protein
MEKPHHEMCLGAVIKRFGGWGNVAMSGSLKLAQELKTERVVPYAQGVNFWLASTT